MGKEKGDPKSIPAGIRKRMVNREFKAVPNKTNERVGVYPDEEFLVRNSKLFCHACKVLKKSSIEYHINSQKHINGKKANKENSNISNAFHAYDSPNSSSW